MSSGCEHCALRKTILAYLERERFRASTTALLAKKDSVGQHEAAARAHEVDNVLTVLKGLFDGKYKPPEKEDGSQEPIEAEESKDPKALP